MSMFIQSFDILLNSSSKKKKVLVTEDMCQKAISCSLWKVLWAQIKMLLFHPRDNELVLNLEVKNNTEGVFLYLVKLCIL